MRRSEYDIRRIEENWKRRWYDDNIYAAEDFSAKPKKYILAEFPYPSGKSMHVGHLMRYTAPDIYSRFLRMRGFNVLYPMGWDAFGLPAENFAIQTGRHPAEATRELIGWYRASMEDMGYGIDWERSFSTTDPSYYKWTQWIFLRFFERGLAELKEEPVWWCEAMKTVLAEEEVIKDADGNLVSERGEHPVEKKLLKQWVLKIPAYADKLLEGLEEIDFPESIKAAQANWIGRSEGARVTFDVAGEPLDVFTTRIDTLFGVTFLVLAPEHPALDRLLAKAANADEARAYIDGAAQKTNLERMQNKEKTGVALAGVAAAHPLEPGRAVPVYVADYVLMDYGTGAVMGVPAHDERDFEFATKHGLPVIGVVEPVTGEPREDEEERTSIVALVEDPATGKLLSINWGPKMGGNLFIGGGLEEGEDPVVCAMREIKEETGYASVELVATSERIHHHYFAVSKNVARNITATGLHFRLSGPERVEPKLEKNEQGKFTVEWITPLEAENRVTDPLHKYVFEKFIRGRIFAGDGVLALSGPFTGIASAQARDAIVAALGERGEKQVTYKIRDWIFSRQRYWGEPIPLVHTADGVEELVHTDDAAGVREKLPLELPPVPDYEPSDDGASPLARNKEWVETVDSEGRPAKRETNTMPNWAGSCWYYLRYADAKNGDTFADTEKLRYWLPVDHYFGGSEHTTMHLLYSRFWHRFLFDEGLVPTKEPYQKRTNGGLLLGTDGRKMSKSIGNVVEPQEKIEKYGADAVRMYVVFMGPYEGTYPYNERSLAACHDFLEDVYYLRKKVSADAVNEGLVRALHKTNMRVTRMYEEMKMNTVVSELMIFAKELKAAEAIPLHVWKDFVLLLAPMAAFLAEELWFEANGWTTADWKPERSAHLQPWPVFDEALAKDDVLSLPVQVNGKLRANVEVASDADEAAVKAAVLADENVRRYLGPGGEYKKLVYVPGRIVNLVV